MREQVLGRGRQARHLFGVLSCAAWLCGAPAPGVAGTAGTNTPHIASFEGGVEAAIDAPWRIEPDYNSSFTYTRIPIVVSIHDTSLQSSQGPNVSPGRFCEMVIVEEPGSSGPNVQRTVFTADQLAEVERSDKWPTSSAPASNHRLCRRWEGNACDANDLKIKDSAEWHGTVLYTPREQVPGNVVRLTVQVRVARGEQDCGPPREALHLTAPFDRLELAPEGNAYLMVNRLQVHLGEEPLPRFGDGWAYGDLHYHSQGTDNEGESAYAYRPTLQAMRAMGLDFLFATEHASDSDQITDVNLVYLRNIDVPDWIPYDEDIEDFVESIPIAEETRTYAKRDMTQQRFEALRAVLNDPPGIKAIGAHTFPTGANAEVMKLPGARRGARIFLGGEIDVVPEMSAAEKASGNVSYGNGLRYRWRNCLLDPKIIEQIHHHSTSLFCPDPNILAELDPATGRYQIHDIQGKGDDSKFSRQHMVYLPTDPARADAFVSGATSEFGGASERLLDLLRPDYYKTIVGRGYAFLAHPADAESGTSITRLGPDIVPYSDLQLRTAFESPVILGLQLWNEDTRLRSNTTNSVPGFPLQAHDAGTAFTKWQWGSWDGPAPQRAYGELHHGLAMWDKMLLWGIRPSQTAGLFDAQGQPLGPDRPRRVFMAGGSDAHGDWNYRRQGRLFGLSSIVDTALGKPRNLVHVGAAEETVSDELGQPHGVVGQGQVTEALASGNFAVTDGPALRIAVDANGNGMIDDGEVTMGGVSLAPTRGKYVPFVVEWKSTDEFGPVARIDLYVGVTNDALDLGFVYAPENHGVHSPTTTSGGRVGNRYVDAQGGLHPELRDGYMFDPTGKLHITLAPAEAKAGRKQVMLRANDFVVGRRRVVQGEPACHENPQCNKLGFPELCDDICTDPPPPTYHFDNVSQPDRIYVRASARTAPKGGALCAQVAPDITDQARINQKTGQCIERLAFTNPVWVDNRTAPPPPGDFGLICAPSSLTVPNAATRTSTCTVTSVNGFSKEIALACLGVPSDTTCSFNPPSVTPPANGTVSATLSVSVGLTPQGTYGLVARASATTTHRKHVGITLTVSGSEVRNLTATYDPARQAPSCGGKPGGSCDTGPSLVFGRGAAAAEPNASNTIAATCADGESAPRTSGRWNANDRIRVYTADGTDLAPGKAARIDATVFASDTPSIEAADFYYAADAANPSWVRIATVTPTGSGTQTLSALYRLPAGDLQAVRVQYRQNSDNRPCAAGAYNDRDDLIFAVAPAP